MRKGNGFTLVEIIVSIAIGSIVLLIAGGIILSSSNFLMTTTDMDIDKRAVDSIVDFVRGEIEYSTDVRFVQHGDELAPNYTEDSDWHYFYIKDNELYRDGAKVFAKSFTNNKSLSISMKGNGTSTSNHRLDIKYALLDNKNEISYSSRDTVMLLNLSVSQEILNQGIYSADYKDLSDNGYWLFYTKKAKDLASIPEEEIKYTGTVADQIKFLNIFTNRNDLYDANMQGATGKYINQYEFVFYKGYWWQLLDQSNYYGYNAEKPDKTYKFKKISSYFDSASAYEQGDIVIYNDEYYRCTNRMVSNGFSDEYYPLNGSWRGNSFWERIDKEKLKNNDGSFKDGSIHINKSRTESQITNYSNTILSKIINLDLSKAIEFDASNNSSIPVVNLSIGVQQNDLYKITETDIISKQKKIRYFIKLFDDTGKLPGQGGPDGCDWQELSMEYIPNSAYATGDRVKQPYTAGGLENNYIKCIKDIHFMLQPLINDIKRSNNDSLSRWEFTQ